MISLPLRTALMAGVALTISAPALAAMEVEQGKAAKAAHRHHSGTYTAFAKATG